MVQLLLNYSVSVGANASSPVPARIVGDSSSHGIGSVHESDNKSFPNIAASINVSGMHIRNYTAIVGSVQ